MEGAASETKDREKDTSDAIGDAVESTTSKVDVKDRVSQINARNENPKGNSEEKRGRRPLQMDKSARQQKKLKDGSGKDQPSARSGSSKKGGSLGVWKAVSTSFRVFSKSNTTAQNGAAQSQAQSQAQAQAQTQAQTQAQQAHSATQGADQNQIVASSKHRRTSAINATTQEGGSSRRRSTFVGSLLSYITPSVFSTSSRSTSPQHQDSNSTPNQDQDQDQNQGQNRNQNQEREQKGQHEQLLRAKKQGESSEVTSSSREKAATENFQIKKTPSFFASLVDKKARNASFATRMKLGMFKDENSDEEISMEQAKEQFMAGLEDSELLQQTRQELRDELFLQVVPVFVKAGDLLFEQGNYGQILYVVISGEMTATRTFPGGKQVKATFSPGMAMAEHCVLMNSPHDYTVHVSKPGLLLAVHRLQYQMAAMTAGDVVRRKRGDQRIDPTGLLYVPLFAPLTEKQRTLVREAMEERTYVPGEKIIGATVNSPGLFIIVSGEVALRTPKATTHWADHNEASMRNNSYRGFNPHAPLLGHKEEQEIEWLCQGDYFSEASLLSGGKQPLGVDVVASTNSSVRCLLLTVESFMDVVSGNSESGVPLLELIRQVHLVRLMGRNPIFSRLNEAQINQLAKNVELRKFGAGEGILLGGTPVSQAGGMYFVTQGLVKLVPEMLGEEEEEQQKNSGEMQGEAEDEAADEEVRNIIGDHSLAPDGDDETTEQRDRKAQLMSDVGEGGSYYGFKTGILGKSQTQSQRILTKMASSGYSSRLLTVDRQSSRLNRQSAKPQRENSNLKQQQDQGQTPEEGEQDFAVLLSGDSFGEDSILVKDPDDDVVQVASVYSMGPVTCGLITREVLDRLGIADLVIAACMEESEGYNIAKEESRPTPAVSASAASSEQTLSRRFLAFDRLEQVASMTANPQTTVGAQIAGKDLKALRRLHHTDLADVWVTFHIASGQLVVVKAVNVSVANKRGLGSYLFTEQTVLAQTSSPFITSLLSAWEEKDTVIVALEPALGGDLESLVNRVKAFKMYQESRSDDGQNALDTLAKLPASTEDAINLPSGLYVGELGGLPFDVVRFHAACAVLALKHLYEHQVTHRDMKPGNLIMDHHGYVKLVDFGIAKQLSSNSSRTFTLCGSPRYMAPELCSLALGSGDGYTAAVDWWALGVILYELATGETPFGKPYSGSRSAQTKSTAATDEKHGRPKDGEKSRNYRVSKKQTATDEAAASRKAYFETFTKVQDFAAGNSNSPSLFEPFEQMSEDIRWNSLYGFIQKLLVANPFVRLGSAFRGPREAMEQSIFHLEDDEQQISPIPWNSIMARSFRAPFVPEKLIVDINEISQVVEDAQSDFSKNGSEDGEGAAYGQRNERSSSVNTLEHKMRGQLEQDETGFMGNQLLKHERARRAMIMKRQQQMKRVAYKHGTGFSSLTGSNLGISASAGTDGKSSHVSTSGTGAGTDKGRQDQTQAQGANKKRKQLAFSVLQKVTVAEAMHHYILSAAKRVFGKKEEVSAVNIQKVWRGRKVRKDLMSLPEAANIVRVAQKLNKHMGHHDVSPAVAVPSDSDNGDNAHGQSNQQT